MSLDDLLPSDPDVDAGMGSTVTVECRRHGVLLKGPADLAFEEGVRHFALHARCRNHGLRFTTWMFFLGERAT